MEISQASSEEDSIQALCVTRIFELSTDKPKTVPKECSIYLMSLCSVWRRVSPT
jgi:hypothetical protein